MTALEVTVIINSMIAELSQKVTAEYVTMRGQVATGTFSGAKECLERIKILEGHITLLEEVLTKVGGV